MLQTGGTIMAKYLQSKTMLRMLLSLCGVLLLPVLILCFLYTGSITDAVEQEAQKIVRNDLSAAVQLVDSEFQMQGDTVKMFQRGNGYQSYLTKAFAYDEEGVASNSHIESDIYYIYLLNDLIDDFFVIIPRSDITFSVSGLYRTSLYLNKYYVDSERTSDEVLYAITQTTECSVLHSKELTTRSGTGEYLTFIYPLQKNIAGNGGIAVFCISTQKLSLFFQARSRDFNTCTYAFSGDGSYLFSYNAQDAHIAYLLETGMATHGENYSTVEINGSRYYLIRQNSAYNNWSYVTLLPIDANLLQSTFQISHFFRIYILLTVILGMVAVVAFLWLNYRPILALRKKAASTLQPSDSKEHPGDSREHLGDDLGAISNALVYLHNKNQALSSTINKNIQEVQSLRLQRLLNNYYSCVEDFNADCEQMGLTFHNNNFYVSIFLFPSLPENPGQLIELLTQELGDAAESKAVYLPKHHQIVFIHCVEEGAAIELEMFYSALGMLHDQLNLPATIGVGHAHMGTELISKSYMQATAALDYRFAKGTGAVITYDDVFNYFSDSYQYPKKEFNRLANALQAKNSISRRQALDALLAYIRDNQMSVMNARCISFDIVKALLSDSNIKQETAYLLPEAFMRLNYVENKNGIISVIQDVCNQIYASETGSDPVPNDQFLRDILEFIDQNYCRCDFSIQEIADHFEILPTSIGSFFKSKMNCGLLEYLISQRINLAKTLLHTTQMPIKEISLSVGYYNVSSFIRRFKQHEGVTPNEYRFKCGGQGFDGQEGEPETIPE